MQTAIHTADNARQRKFLFILPLLTLPFLTMMFWALGGGSGRSAVNKSSGEQGLNLKLPDAKLKDDKTLDKLSFYNQAALDSAKAKEAEKLDPYWNKNMDDSNLAEDAGLENNDVDANQTKVYNKLNELKAALNKSRESDVTTRSNYHSSSTQLSNNSNDVDRLQTMMQKMNEEKNEDPEITQLNHMLDKIQAIQNPGQNKPDQKEKTSNSLIVKAKVHKVPISLANADKDENAEPDTNIVSGADNRFYSTSYIGEAEAANSKNTIEAVIPETQTLVSGSTIKLILSNDVTIQDMDLPSGTAVFGTASLSNERLKIDITTIRFQNAILPVSLSVYDMDGQEGIYIPGSVSRTVAKESANNAISGIGATTIDPSIGAELASAGIETAKTLFSKKVKLIKVTVRSGYKVLLKDSHNK